MAYTRSFCVTLLSRPKSAQMPIDRALVVPDLTQDAKFENHPDVIGYPNVRFMALSPIISPKGVVIGSYTVLDDKPRPSLDPVTAKFLLGMSTTVMKYLDASRSKAQHLRAERMIVGIGSFLEGKGSLRHSWLGANGMLDEDDDQKDNEGKMNEKQQNQQVLEQVTREFGKTKGRLGPLRAQMPTRSHKGSPNRRSARLEHSRHTIKPLDTLPETNTTSSTNPRKSGSQLSDDDHKSQVAETFSRGANIIRESIEVEAVLFFDANFNSRGTFMSNEQSDQDSSDRDSDSSASKNEDKIRGASTEDGHSSTANAQDSGNTTVNPCELLGFSTSGLSSVNDEMLDDKKIALSEPFLAALLHRYPRGKIFNFFADGSISASETSDGNYKNFSLCGGNQTKSSRGAHRRSKKYKRTRQAIMRQDAETLLELAPDARSIIFSPLWDSHKGRWSSAGIAWTRSPHRVFTSDDELSFMFAFGNSIMAEVHRLSALFAEQSKSSLLAGLSHELRSPLHGIFGMADLLNTSAITTIQRGFIHTISSCAFTLLGSINQLLEYANINDLRASAASAQLSSGPDQAKLVKAGEDLQSGQVDPDSFVQLDVTMEDAIETVFAGYSMFNGLQFPLDATHGGSFFKAGRFDGPDGVQVVVDIYRSPTPDWTFFTRPGAWHVILTNLVGNALKFTQHGYIHVSLNTSPDPVLGEEGEVIRSNVVVTVRDTGCGISPEFLKNGLYLPFSQEDDMTTGNGLGLNITQRIVLSLGGTIEVDSQQGVGTEVKVSVHLDHVAALGPLEVLNPSSDRSLEVAKALIQGKTVQILGSGLSPLGQLLESSLRHVCKEWLQMNISLSLEPENSPCDFYITRFEPLQNGTLDFEYLTCCTKERFTAPLIVVCPSPRIAHSMYVEYKKQRDAKVVEFISQPCGPRKLAKTFEICYERQCQQIDSANAESDIAAGFPGPPVPLHKVEAEGLPFEGLHPESSEQSSIQLTPTESNPLELKPCKPDPQGDQAPVSVLSPDSVNDGDSSIEKSDKLSIDDPPLQLQKQAKKVLIVDDNEINVRILIEFMKKLGCEYQSASNGLQALEIFKENAPSIAIIFMGKLETENKYTDHHPGTNNVQTFPCQS